ncbi:MAG: GEVED domain-containing protein [Cyanobacteria bacterium J06631_6]
MAVNSLFNRRCINLIPQLLFIIWMGSFERAIAQVENGSGGLAGKDFGDAPDSYNDASHDVSDSPELYLGVVAPDAETDTRLTSSLAAGDDDDGNDDEDAFVALPNVPLVDPNLTSLSLGRKYSLAVPLTNNTGGDATLYAWVDFNQNGKFEAGEYQSATVENGDTAASLTWDIPLITLVGDTYARFRLTSDSLSDRTQLLDPLTILGVDERSLGNATNGEVEDYPVSIALPLVDYGDAPDRNSGTEMGDYQTTESDGGPSHVVVDTLGLNFSLGNNVDGDDGSLQSENADADDLDGTSVDLLGTLIGGGSTNLNDEDGVDVDNLPVLTADAGQTYTIPVTVRNNIPLLDGFVVGYIDFNRDGDFADAGEKSTTAIASPVTSVSGSASTNGSSTSASGSVDNTGLRTVNVTFTVPGGVTPGDTYARFRLGSIQEVVESATGVSVSGSNGEINNGEVEDYQIAIAAATNSGNNEPTDFGDAPDSYRAASHDITTAPGLYLGNVAPDGEADTQLTSAASAGDDDDGNDDEDAFVYLPNVPLLDPTLTELSVGRNYELTVPVTNTTGREATLHAWIDFNQNNKFEADEYRAVPVNSGETSVSLSWDLGGILGFLNLLNLPLSSFAGDTHARFRLTSDELTDLTGVLDVLNLGIDDRAYGAATDGEVEDYPINVTAPLYDYGDAPDTGTGTARGNYKTTEGDEGPTHIVIKDPLDLLHLSLGDTVDGDDGSLQNDSANADDADTKDVDVLNTILSNSDTGLDDEDGIASFPPLTATPGQTYTVPVTVRNNVPLLEAYLVGYIDFNRDGDFNDPGEKSATVTVASDLLTIAPNRLALDTSGAPRTFNVNFTVPAGVVRGDTYARFRLGSIKEIVESATTIAVITSNGEVNNGEVEDYGLAIAPAAPSVISIGGQLIDDLNYNGVQDEGETGRDGVTFNLFNLENEPVASIVTANGGLYDFGDLPSGEYYLQIDTPDNTILKGSSGDAQSSFNRVTDRTDPFVFTSGEPLIFDAAIAQDTDGDKIADVNELGDRDGDGVADAEEIDPEGFFYEETSGRILTGGSISVMGPSPDSVNLVDDGADGSYQFFGRETGRYTISIDSPPGYEPSTSCTVTGESFDPTGGEDPTSLGSGEDGNTGVLVEPDCAANTFYLAFDLERGDPFVINNNLPFKAIANPNQTIVTTSSCLTLGGTLSGNNLFTPLDGGTFGFENGDPNQSPANNPYPGVVSGGNYQQFYSTAFNYGDYSYVANPVIPRNPFQHPGITDPIYGVTGRFFASDPDISTPTLSTTLTGLTPNQFYEYSFWAANSEPAGNPNDVNVLINGQLIYNTDALPAIPTALEWKKHTVSFTNGSRTSITIDLESTKTGRNGNDFYLDNIELRRCDFITDFGDAPPSYGEALQTTIPSSPNVYLGTVAPDSEATTPLGNDNGAGADGDDDTSAGIDDEDGFSTFDDVVTSGTYALDNIPVHNTSGKDVTLHGWIDFDRDGKFSVAEYQSATVTDGAVTTNLSWTIPNGTTVDRTYARFRLTADVLLQDDPNTADVDERSQDAAVNGEVEDYQITVTASDPSLLLVKRITAINRDRPGEILFDSFVNDNTADDNNSSWLGFQASSNSSGNTNTYTLGEINGGEVKPGDEVEYTIYFLSAGGKTAANVFVCDLIPDNMEFVTTGFESEPAATIGLLGTAKGLLWEYNSEVESLSNAIDGDGGSYFPPGVEPINAFPTVQCGNPSQPNTNGAVVIDLGSLPNATAPGTPSNSYGFVRFRAVVK